MKLACGPWVTCGHPCRVGEKGRTGRMWLAKSEQTGVKQIRIPRGYFLEFLRRYKRRQEEEQESCGNVSIYESNTKPD